MPLYILRVKEEYRLTEDLEVAALSAKEAVRMYHDGEVSTNISVAEKVDWEVLSITEEAP